MGKRQLAVMEIGRVSEYVKKGSMGTLPNWQMGCPLPRSAVSSEGDHEKPACLHACFASSMDWLLSLPLRAMTFLHEWRWLCQGDHGHRCLCCTEPPWVPCAVCFAIPEVNYPKRLCGDFEFLAPALKLRGLSEKVFSWLQSGPCACMKPLCWYLCTSDLFVCNNHSKILTVPEHNPQHSRITHC